MIKNDPLKVMEERLSYGSYGNLDRRKFEGPASSETLLGVAKELRDRNESSHKQLREKVEIVSSLLSLLIKVQVLSVVVITLGLVVLVLWVEGVWQ